MQTLSLATTAGLAMAGSGCAAIAGVQDAEFNFTIDPLLHPTPDGSFRWFTELTITYDTSSVNLATLFALTVDVVQPKGMSDLSFLQDVKGEAVVGEMRTLVTRCDKFPRGEQAVVMQVLYHGDLRPFFVHGPKGDTIRIEWEGHINTAFTQWPPGGIVVRARAKISIE